MVRPNHPFGLILENRRVEVGLSYKLWGNTFATPGPDGLMPEPDVKRLKAFGDEIKQRFSNPVASASGAGEKITLKFPSTEKVNQVVLMEDISKGERVREFVLEGKTKQGWQLIFKGSCIGYKFIHRFDEMEVSEVRLVVTESKGEPAILVFSIFNSTNSL
jgi:alpha-L-fucosidase